MTLLKTKGGDVKACLENVHRLLADQTNWEFTFNEMGGHVMCNGIRLTSPMITMITRWCQTRGVMVSSAIVNEAVGELAEHQHVHPVRDYLNGLTWDGAERLSQWLATYLGAENTDYTRAIGRKWMISAVARAMKPGCKADCLLVLEGPQGILKSSALQVLAGNLDWYLEDLRDFTGKDALIQFAGKWLVELSELQGTKGTENARLKAFLSCRVDNYRPPYGRVAQDFPRSVVFAGTINESEYLKDPTGARRYWCFECGTIKLDALKNDRDQLWAEAVHAFRAGEKWYLEDAEIIKAAQEEQEARRIQDPWESPIANFLENRETTTVDSVLSHLEQPPGGSGIPGGGRARPKIARTKTDQMRVAEILRILGWEKKRLGHARTRSWVRNAQDGEPPPDEVVLQGGSTGGSTQNPQKPPQNPHVDPRDPHVRFPRMRARRECSGAKGGSGGSPRQKRQGNGQSRVELPPDSEVVHGGSDGPTCCACCREPIDLAGGYTATGSGDFLHNSCVDQWHDA
jgi:predicted P-loop ATPase